MVSAVRTLTFDSDTDLGETPEIEKSSRAP